MEKNEVDLVIRLLRSALWQEAADKTFLRELTTEDWNKACRLAQLHGVLGVAWDGFKRWQDAGEIPADNAPQDQTRIKWAFAVNRIQQGYAHRMTVIERLARFYREHHISMMVLKGYGLSLLYPVPEHRPCSDIDIWLYGQHDKANAFMRKEWGIAIDEDKHKHTTFLVDGVMVENHFDLLHTADHISNLAFDTHLRKLVAEPAHTIVVGSESVCLPSPEFNAIFLLRHAAEHFAAAEISLRQVVDWTLFLHKHAGDIDWPALERLMRQNNMHRFLHCMNAFAIDYLGLIAENLPDFGRNAVLEKQVWEEILFPRFVSSDIPRGGFLVSFPYRLRRRLANRWKHRIVYRESVWKAFLRSCRAHLQKPGTLKMK